MELRRRFNRIFLVLLVFLAALRSVSARLCASFSCSSVYFLPRPLSYGYACARKRKTAALPASVNEALATATLERDSGCQCEPSLRGLCSAVTSLAVPSLMIFSSTISSMVERFCAVLPRQRLCAVQHAGVALCPLGSVPVASSSSAVGVVSEAPRHTGLYGAVIAGFLSLFAAKKPPVPLSAGPYTVVKKTVNSSIFSTTIFSTAVFSTTVFSTTVFKVNGNRLGMPSASAMPLAE